MKPSEEIIDALDRNDWGFCESSETNGEYCAEVSKYSPAGEDFCATIWWDGTDKGFVDAFQAYADAFDSDEHAMLWVDSSGKNGVPSTIRELIDDAEAIKNMLLDMADTLAQVI